MSTVFTGNNRYACPILMKIEIRQIFEKYTNIKFHEKPSSESRVIPCGQTDVRTGMTKLTVGFRNFANEPNKGKMFGEIMCAHHDRNSLSIYKRQQYFEIVDN